MQTTCLKQFEGFIAQLVLVSALQAVLHASVVDAESAVDLPLSKDSCEDFGSEETSVEFTLLLILLRFKQSHSHKIKGGPLQVQIRPVLPKLLDLQVGVLLMHIGLPLLDSWPAPDRD